MALFPECMRWCAFIVLDTADIVRDGDVSAATRWFYCSLIESFHSTLWLYDLRYRH